MPLDLTTISGTITRNDGSAVANPVLHVMKALKDGALIWRQSVSYEGDEDGLIEFTAPRDSITYIKVEVEGLNNPNGVAIRIPDAATADLEDLLPATTVTVSGVTTGQLATVQAAVDALNTEIDALTAGAPSALDTLNELAAAINDDANFAATVTTALAGKQATSEKNQANGYAGLDGSGLIADNRLPASIARDSEVTAAVAVEAAAREAADLLLAPLASPTFTGTVSGVTKGMVGLGNVDNTSDADKPVSTATQTALDAKQPLDADLTAIAALTPSNDDVLQRKGGAWTNRTPAQLKADLALAKGDVGLGNVDNTSDANKPVSTAQAAADADVLADANAYTDAAVAGVTPTGEQLVNSETIDLNDTSPQVVYTVPVGKKFALTRAMLRDLTQAGGDGNTGALAVTSGSSTINLTNVDSMTAPQINSGAFTGRATPALAGANVTATPNVAYGSANPATLDVFGILYDA